METTELILLSLKAIGLVTVSFAGMSVCDLFFIQPTRK